jgi:hypothetical protein
MCELPIENVYWPVRTAPAGDYRVWVSAHAVIPAGDPVDFQLQVFRGKEVAWRRKGSLYKSDELYGPFVYSFPAGKVTGPLAGASALPQCGVMRFMPPDSSPE